VGKERLKNKIIITIPTIALVALVAAIITFTTTVQIQQA
jgi:hypothetical protein